MIREDDIGVRWDRKKNFLYKIIGKKISFQTSNNVPGTFLDDIFSVQFVPEFSIYNIRHLRWKLAILANFEFESLILYIQNSGANWTEKISS